MKRAGKKVLVADDDDSARGVAKLLLIQAGFEVEETDNGLGALAGFERLQSDLALVVLDVAMPGMTGTDVARLIRRRSLDVPILLLSGFDERGAASSLCGHGPTVFLAKPYRIAEFLTLVTRYTGAADEAVQSAELEKHS